MYVYQQTFCRHVKAHMYVREHMVMHRYGACVPEDDFFDSACTTRREYLLTPFTR